MILVELTPLVHSWRCSFLRQLFMLGSLVISNKKQINWKVKKSTEKLEHVQLAVSAGFSTTVAFS